MTSNYFAVTDTSESHLCQLVSSGRRRKTGKTVFWGCTAFLWMIVRRLYSGLSFSKREKVTRPTFLQGSSYCLLLKYFFLLLFAFQRSHSCYLNSALRSSMTTLRSRLWALHFRAALGLICSFLIDFRWTRLPTPTSRGSSRLGRGGKTLDGNFERKLGSTSALS